MDTENKPYRETLRRVGLVLIVIGLIDIGWMVYCIIHGISYRSSLNLFAVIAGVLLVCGSLRTAATVRWFGLFFLSASVALLFAWPVLQPIDLTLTEIRLDPGGSAGNAAFVVFIVALLYWVVTELGRDPVQVAIDSAGLKRRDMRLPVALGIALVVGLGVSLHFFLGGESAARAISIAEKQLGPGYRWTVRSLSINGRGGTTSVSGVVTAWNDKEIRQVPVHWESRE